MPLGPSGDKALCASVIDLLGRRAAGWARTEDLVEWAVQKLLEGYDRPALRGLAACSRPYYWSELEQAFAAVLDELDMVLPSEQECLRSYARVLAQQLLADEVAMAPVLRRFKELWLLLEYPAELQNLAYLAYAQQDLETQSQTYYYPDATHENLADLVRMEARELLNAPSL